MSRISPIPAPNAPERDGSPAPDPGHRGLSRLLSIVVPACNEEENLPVLLDRITEILSPENHLEWEVVFVDDGSRDHTWKTIRCLAQKNGRARGVRLSRNFGHQYALMAGLEHARGDAMITMDADLQHPPEMIPRMIEAWRQGYRIVKMVRQDPPSTGLWKKISSRMYYHLFAWLSDVPIHPGLADFRLLDRQVLEEVRRFREEGLFLRGIVEWVGFDSCELTYQALERLKGKSKYNLKKMLRLGWHGISSFSTFPLRIGILFGITGTVLSLFGILYALYGKLIEGEAVPGWASIMMGISLLFSLLFVYLGIMGEYIARIVIEVRGRPRFIVMDKIGFDRNPVGESVRA